MQRHFGVTLAFMNCHRSAAFRTGAEQDTAYREFSSVRARLLVQIPELATADSREQCPQVRRRILGRRFPSGEYQVIVVVDAHGPLR
ncbi:hypothetical protein [Streptomyces cynarae]|uniref:hypothetical protein n=1 Tax=Streptomyces cynarae TaxID=2981134 RepID=UPI0036F2D281